MVVLAKKRSRGMIGRLLLLYSIIIAVDLEKNI